MATGGSSPARSRWSSTAWPPDCFVVTARTSGGTNERKGVSLFLVNADSPGLQRAPRSRVDLRGAAGCTLDGVRVGRDHLIGDADAGLDVLEPVSVRAIAGLTAEMLGSLLQAFEMTVEYLKTRKQFGVLIGTFQALKHRAANIYTESELARSAVTGLCQAIDSGSDDARVLAHVAKARLNDVFLLTANEGVQMHGGIGMTDEHDIGFFLKRARGAEMTLGDSAWHRRRYAEIHGF